MTRVITRGHLLGTSRHNRVSCPSTIAPIRDPALDPDLLPPMTESDLRAVLLLRAVEPIGVAADRLGDAEWASREARRRLGEQAPPEAWLGERARLALARLGEREPGLRRWLQAQLPGIDGRAGGAASRWAAALLLLTAALLGLAGETVGATHHINLLAPPLLGLLVWNLGVYAWLAVQALRAAWRPSRQAQARGVHPAHGPQTAHGPHGAGGPLLRGLLAGAARLQSALGAAAESAATTATTASVPIVAALAAARARFHRDWLAATAPLQAARAVALLHAAAALLALGALASLYARGLVLDYRAGWDSTFLDAGQVRAALGVLLGPAAAFSGQLLPDAAALAGLRLSQGGGEGAARWIHLWAITLLGAVVLPRLALAAAAAWRARRLATQLPLPDDDGLRRLLRSASGQPLAVAVLPYSYQLDAARQAALLQVLDDLWGPGVLPQLQPSLPLGAEDDLPRGLPQPLPATVVALFALTATPERETHGAFLRALAGQMSVSPTANPAAGRALEVMVDESGFRQRLAGQSLGERLAQRRAAWLALAAEQGLVPRFINLRADA